MAGGLGCTNSRSQTWVMEREESSADDSLKVTRIILD